MAREGEWETPAGQAPGPLSPQVAPPGFPILGHFWLWAAGGAHHTQMRAATRPRLATSPWQGPASVQHGRGLGLLDWEARVS